jgi:hypothetical protein
MTSIAGVTTPELLCSPLSSVRGVTLPSRQVPIIPDIFVISAPLAKTESGRGLFDGGSEDGDDEEHTRRLSFLRLIFPRLDERRKDLNGDIRDCNDTGNREMTVDILLSVVRSQITSS